MTTISDTFTGTDGAPIAGRTATGPNGGFEEYVRSETNARNVLDSLLRLLSPKTQENFRLSRQARERYEESLPSPRHGR
jgi:hypothetical protein